jgi:hypothetical protein
MENNMQNLDTSTIPDDLKRRMIAGTETVVCHTGTSPNSAAHAKIIAGLWNSVIDALMAAPVPSTPAE